MVECDRCRQRDAERGLQVVLQRDRGQRVEPERDELGIRLHLVRVEVEDVRDGVPHRGRDRRPPVRRRLRGQRAQVDPAGGVGAARGDLVVEGVGQRHAADQPAPVELADHGLRHRRGQQPGQRTQPGGRPEEPDALRRDPGDQVPPQGRRHASLRPGSPVDARPGQPLSGTPAHQRVQEGVAGGVVRLGRRAEHGRDRGVADEEVQLRERGRSLVQQQGAVHLGPEHRVDPVPALPGNRRVRQYSGRVDNAADRHRPMPQRRGDPVDVGRIADVAGVHGGPGAEPRGQSGDILARNGSPADQGEVPGPKGDQLLRRGQPERPQPAGDQVGPVRPDLHRRGGALLGEPDHELADVRAAAERRERLVELLRGVPGGRDRPQLAGREQIHHRPQDPRDDLAQFRLGPVAEVEAAVRHIGPYRRHLVGRPDPGPAELDVRAASDSRPPETTHCSGAFTAATPRSG